MADAHKIVSRFNGLKTFPDVAVRLSRLLADSSVTIEAVDALIRMDPALVSRLLRLVNSAYFSLLEKVSDIPSAVVFIGMDNLRNMVVVQAMKHLFVHSEEVAGFSPKKLWLHSAVVAIISQAIAERFFEIKGEDAFLSGILHDIGLMVEHQALSEPFSHLCAALHESKDIAILEMEQTHLGLDHSDLGALLVSDWGLPDIVVSGIRAHHSATGPMSAESIPGIVQIAEYLALQMRYSVFPELAPKLHPALRIHVHDRISDYRALLEDLPEVIRDAADLYALDEGNAYVNSGLSS